MKPAPAAPGRSALSPTGLFNTVLSRLGLDRINFARLNHVLIPQSAEERTRIRRSRAGRAIEPLFDVLWSITPAGRAILLAALIIGALGGLTLRMTQSQVYLVFCALFGALAVSAVVRRSYRLVAVRVEVATPPRVLLGEEISFAVTLHNEGKEAALCLQVSGPPLPWDGQWLGSPPEVTELAPGASAQVHCRARFVDRGAHHLESFEVSGAVPLGLMRGPLLHGQEPRFLVVPRVAAIARLTTPTTRKYQPGGIVLASRTGESRELLGVRPYRQGDPVRDLHAKTWARTGKPSVREYREEYFTRLGVVVDTDGLIAHPRQFEAALSLAAGIVAHLTRGESLIDLLVVGDRVHSLTLGRSLGFLEQALDLLACVRPGPAFSGEVLATRLGPHLSRLSFVVFVALEGDAERLSFVDRVQGQGVGCRMLQVLPPHRWGESADSREQGRAPDLVPTEAIEGGEPLWL